MEKLRELMKEHQDKADKKVMGEVLEIGRASCRERVC